MPACAVLTGGRVKRYLVGFTPRPERVVFTIVLYLLVGIAFSILARATSQKRLHPDDYPAFIFIAIIWPVVVPVLCYFALRGRLGE